MIEPYYFKSTEFRLFLLLLQFDATISSPLLLNPSFQASFWVCDRDNLGTSEGIERTTL